jgi:nitrate reductase gamma subunit
VACSWKRDDDNGLRASGDYGSCYIDLTKFGERAVHGSGYHMTCGHESFNATSVESLKRTGCSWLSKKKVTTPLAAVIAIIAALGGGIYLLTRKRI